MRWQPHRLTNHRVEKIENGQTTVDVGQRYEKNLSTGVATVYYYAGGQRVALPVAFRGATELLKFMRGAGKSVP